MCWGAVNCTLAFVSAFCRGWPQRPQPSNGLRAATKGSGEPCDGMLSVGMEKRRAIRFALIYRQSKTVRGPGKSMRNFVSRTQTVSYGNHKANGSVSRLRQTGTYNSSALPLEFDNTTPTIALSGPQLLKRYAPAGAVTQGSMFKGLDQYPSNRSRGTSILAFLIHFLIALTVLWLGTITASRVVQSESTAVTLYDPPPPPGDAGCEGAGRRWRRRCASSGGAQKRKGA